MYSLSSCFEKGLCAGHGHVQEEQMRSTGVLLGPKNNFATRNLPLRFRHAQFQLPISDDLMFGSRCDHDRTRQHSSLTMAMCR